MPTCCSVNRPWGSRAIGYRQRVGHGPRRPVRRERHPDRNRAQRHPGRRRADQARLGSGSGGGSSKAGKSDPKTGKLDSKSATGDSHVNLGDDLTLGSSTATLKGGGSALKREAAGRAGSDLDLTAAGEGLSDDELVLGGSSGAGSDVTLGGDSGISLVDPADSGLSLEEPLDLAAAGDESLELGEDNMISLADEAIDHDAATQLKSDDDFLLTPAVEAGDEGEDPRAARR